MRARSIVFLVAFALLACFAAGCKKGQQGDAAPAPVEAATSSGPACNTAGSG